MYVLCCVVLQSYIATQIMVDSKMLRGHRQDGEQLLLLLFLHTVNDRDLFQPYLTFIIAPLSGTFVERAMRISLKL